MQSDWKQASEHFRRGSDVILRRARRGTLIVGHSLTGQKKSEAARSSFNFALSVKAANRLSRQEPASHDRLADEMFKIAQWASGSEAAASLAQMAARQSKEGGDLARLVRERQDKVAEWQKLDALRSAAVSLAPDKRDSEAEAANAERLAAIDARLAAIDKRLAAEFPDYAALASPQPLKIAEVQANLKPDEAAVLFLDTPKWEQTSEETFIWVVTKTASRWLRSDLGTEALKQRVQTLRAALDSTAGSARGAMPLDGSNKKGFDLGLAHELYAALLGPAAALLKGKSHLIVVPSGPLTALPFQVLVTSKPAGDGQSDYRRAGWLIRRHAITTLPSVASLKSLRRTTARAKPAREFVGFANPVFKSDNTVTPLQTARAEAKRGFAGYFRGARGDAGALSALAPLPDTEDEVRAIAKAFGAKAAVYAGKQANEARIKALPLHDYRIVHFATHGLIAGEVEKLAEPALALSAPAIPSGDNDGLLTASEVTALKLNADWVILSACNTAAGERPGAEAFSGLAQAFFYAGTRALLVSHWPVVSAAAVRLTTKTFARLRDEPEMGRSEALRQAMLELIDKGQSREAHPSYWAPFVVVGEGAAR